MPTPFTPESLKFLRGLAKHNDREWFEPRKPIYERAIKAPMLALIEDINAAMDTFAPQHIRPPHKTMMRIYRDIRFSNDKRPYKRNVAAWWARRGMEKTSGGGYYLHIGPQEVAISIGVYMPEREQLLTIRRWMSANHETYRQAHAKLLRSKPLTMTGIDAALMTRIPKGFAKDDPADDLLRARNWGVHALLPAEAALEPTFAREVIKRFRAATPLINLLNNAILGSEEERIGNQPERRKPMF